MRPSNANIVMEKRTCVRPKIEPLVFSLYPKHMALLLSLTGLHMDVQSAGEAYQRRVSGTRGALQ